MCLSPLLFLFTCTYTMHYTGTHSYMPVIVYTHPPVTGSPCTMPSLRATLLRLSLAIFGVSTFLMVARCSSLDFSRPECLVSSCLIALRKVSWDAVTLARNWAQMLLARREALRLLINCRVYFSRQAAFRGWFLKDVPCCCWRGGGERTTK
jgi:hypothetical protein